MRTITIKGTVIIEENNHKSQQIINEGFKDSKLFGWLKSGGKGAFEGMMTYLSGLLPGFNKEEKRVKSEYEQAVNEYTEKWATARKTALEKEAEHKATMQTKWYQIEQERKLAKFDAEEKKKEIKRKQEKDAANLVLKQLKAEREKIKNCTLGPTGPEYLSLITERVNKVCEGVVPADKQVAMDLLGVVTACRYDENGNFISDPTAIGERFKKLYPDGSAAREAIVNNPDWNRYKQAYIDQVTSISDSSKTQSAEEFAEMVQVNIVENPNFKTKAELQQERKSMDDKLQTLHNAEAEINNAKKEKSDAEKRVKQMKTALENHDKSEKFLKAFADKTGEGTNSKYEPKQPQAVKNAMKEHLQNLKTTDKDGNEKEQDYGDIFSYVVENVQPAGNDATRPVKAVINKNSEVYKQMIAMGMTDEQIEKTMESIKPTNIPASDKQPGPLKPEDITGELKSSLPDSKDIKKAVAKGVDSMEPEQIESAAKKAINKAKQDVDAYDRIKQSNGGKDPYKEAQDKVKQVDEKIAQNESLVNAAMNDPTLRNQVLSELGVQDDGKALTASQIEKARNQLDVKIKNRDKAQQTVQQYREEAQNKREKSENKDKYDKFYNDQTAEKRAELDKEVEKSVEELGDEVVQKEGDRQYIENDKGEKIYKPADDDPDYDTKMKAWDAMVDAKIADIKLQAPNPPAEDTADKDEWLEYKKYEEKVKAQKAAKNRSLENWKKVQKELGHAANDQDALDAMEDRDFFKNEWAGAGDDADYEDNEGQDEDDDETAEEKQKRTERDAEIADLENKLKDSNLSDEEKAKIQSKLDAAKKERDDADNQRETSGKANPAKIWKKRKNKSTGKTTKRYYYCGPNAKRKQSDESISQAEYQALVKKFQDAKKAKAGQNATQSTPKDATQDTTQSTPKNATQDTVQDGESYIYAKIPNIMESTTRQYIKSTWSPAFLHQIKKS